MENRIGIDQDKAQELADHLNKLLANYQIYYQNLRGFHWNIKGKEFFDLHEKFELLYTKAQVSIDEIAERILTLGYTPLHTYEDYLEKSEVKVAKDVSKAEPCVQKTLEALKTIISIERDLLEVVEEAGDNGTDDLISGYLYAQETETWMLASYLG